MTTYIIYTFISLGLSYAVYVFLLKNQKTFQFNRFYLLITLLLCLLSPILEIEMFDAIPKISAVNFEVPSNLNLTNDFSDEGIAGATAAKQINAYDVIWCFYFVISIAFILRFLINLFSILKLVRNSNKRLGNLIQVEVDENEQVSSFLNYIFINSSKLVNDDFAESIIAHEGIHYKQLHTLDLIFIEFVLCFFWFNPFLWFYKIAILQNHEFIADSQVVSSGIDLNHYAKAIIGLGQKEHRVPLTSGFNFIQIKNRIIMLNQSKSSISKRVLRIITAVLLFAGIFMFSAFKEIKEPLIVVIDAGHGGRDQGNSNEKEVVLQISNLLKSLEDDKIKIIQTRSEDEFLSLKERAQFVNKQHPDVFISLHCNTSINPESNGVEIFSSNKGAYNKQSLGYGWLLLDQQLKNKVVSNGKMKNAEFYLLKTIECPRLVMELGFLSNPNDNSRLNNKAHQEDIAKALYEGLIEIRDKKELIALLDNR